MVDDRAPRLVIVTLTLDTGGTERHIAQIAPRLVERGFDVTVVCLGRPGVLAAEVRRQGVRVIGPGAVAAGFYRSGIGTARALTIGTVLLARELIARKPDIAHFFLPLAYIVGARLARWARVPHLVMSRRSQNDYQAKRPRLARCERSLHRHMDLILANSRRVHAELVDGENADPARTGLIYNGLDLSAHEPQSDRENIRTALDIPSSTLVLAIVANLIPYKGHSDLIDALGRAKAELASDWCLLVIGRNDGLEATLRARAESLRIADRIRWLGERRDVPDLLRAADIGLNVSHEEGFSNAVIEGLAAGLPMLVTDVGGNAEAVPHGIAGLVVPPRAPAAIASALLELARNPKRRSDMGRAARERSERLYSLASCVDHYQQAYLAMLREAPMPVEIDPRRMHLASGHTPG
ncbi:MAG: glycosyltransferase [Hyphomicrobiaceae bacterium]